MIDLNGIFHLAVALLLFTSILQPNLTAISTRAQDQLAILQSTTAVVPDNYTTIQEAIDAASPGDTIQVRSGTYDEKIFINKTISLLGENPETTIIVGSKDDATLSPVVNIFGEDTKNVKVRNFTLTGSTNSWGIQVSFYASAWIEKNIITNNSGGILTNFSNNNTVFNNTVANNKFEGILFLDSSGNTMKNNTMSGNSYNFGICRSPLDHDIDNSNLINGKPIQYLKNQSSISINPTSFPSIGYLALVNCTNITVENLTLQNNYNGILMTNTNNSTLRNNNLTDNVEGLSIINSTGNVIEANDIVNSTWLAISLDHSPENTFTASNLVNNYSPFKITGDSPNDFTQHVDASNSVNGKAVYYLMNRTDLVINPSSYNNIGYLALVNCRNITVDNLSLENNELLAAFTQDSSITENTMSIGGINLAYSSSVLLADNKLDSGEVGISVYHSDGNTIARNTVTNSTWCGILIQSSSNNAVSDNNVNDNSEGLELGESSNNTVFLNNITGSREYGVLLRNSSGNLFFHNNFINDIPWQVVSSLWSMFNEWDDGYPSGGNYWKDYNGTDFHSGPKQNETGSDGIGDTRYTNFYFFGPVDHYPLMQPVRVFAAKVCDGKSCDIEAVSNSTFSGFELDYNAKTVSFNVTGEEGTEGFCRIIIPNIIIRDLWNLNYNVIINGEQWPFKNWTDAYDTYVYISYMNSEHEITIVPEFPIAAILPLSMVVAVFAAIKRPRRTGATKSETSVV
jgi:parallel beta-helix repeat protein